LKCSKNELERNVIGEPKSRETGGNIRKKSLWFRVVVQLEHEEETNLDDDTKENAALIELLSMNGTPNLAEIGV